jgi:hypothetical protein
MLDSLGGHGHYIRVMVDRKVIVPATIMPIVPNLLVPIHKPFMASLLGRRELNK